MQNINELIGIIKGINFDGVEDEWLEDLEQGEAHSEKSLHLNCSTAITMATGINNTPTERWQGPPESLYPHIL